MHANLQIDAKSSAEETHNRTENLHNNNYNITTTATTTPNLQHKSNDQHSLSIMPPSYRYANSELSSAASFKLLPLTRRRWLQRHTCFLCIVGAFMFGLVLGVFVPLLNLRNVFTNADSTPETMPLMLGGGAQTHNNNARMQILTDLEWVTARDERIANHTTTTKVDEAPRSAFSVAFINERQAKVETAEMLSDGAHASALNLPTYAGYKSLNKRDYQQEALLQTAELRASKALRIQTEPLSSIARADSKNVPQRHRNAQTIKTPPPTTSTTPNIINAHIFWGELVERALPQGFSAQDTRDWNAYVASQIVVQRLEQGCGRMQNRLLIFQDGTRACARYRQNTDQIQGELFSFYLGRLLNMSNLAPSAVLTVNVESEKWSSVVRDITQAQWKQQRPVVLTRWLPNLEPAGIPQPFQPLDRHLNKFDVWNITTSLMAPHDSVQTRALNDLNALPSALDASITPNSLALERLVELAQWSDLIVFDYLIANLDRVVNNLYNYQWNAEIMAAPAHNLARQSNSQLLIFLDNESGLLHGYRLLKKYEAYHGLLLNNLCVFREPTIRALRQLRAVGAGRKLRELFEQTTSEEVRAVLPTLPDKSIKILIDRIDRVLGQVDNCKQLMNSR